jgi:hypothetical protein
MHIDPRAHKKDSQGNVKAGFARQLAWQERARAALFFAREAEHDLPLLVGNGLH